MKTKAHTQYKLKNGTKVPGTTTIIGLLAKPALLKWANNLGLQGIDCFKYRDDKAEIGTLAHYLIMCYLKGEKPDTKDYTANQINQAENSILSFWEWEKSHPLKPILIETPLVSEKYCYGGTIDLLAEVNGDVCLIDFKTGKGIFPEMGYQLAAYRQLLIENDFQVDNARILRIGRDEDEGFEEKLFTSLSKEWQIFYHLREIYKLIKEGKNGK